MSFKEFLKATNLKEAKAALKGTKKTAIVENTPEVEEVPKEAVLFTPSLPKVNIIPSNVFEKYQVKGIARKFALIGIGIVVLLILIYGGGITYLKINNGQLSTLSNKQSALTNQVAQLQPYTTYQTAISSKRSTLYSSVQDDINMGTIYGNINNAAKKANVSVLSTTVTQSKTSSAASLAAAPSGSDATSGSACINPDPFGSSSDIIGCIQLSGTAPNQKAVNSFLANLQGSSKTPSYKNPFISAVTNQSKNSTQSTTGTASSTWSATISFTKVMYSNQYVSLNEPLSQLLTSTKAPKNTTGNSTAPTKSPSSFGYAALQAKSVITNLTTDEGKAIDGIAITVCNTPQSNRQNQIVSSSKAIEALLKKGHPTINSTTITNNLMDTITTNCSQVLTTTGKG